MTNENKIESDAFVSKYLDLLFNELKTFSTPEWQLSMEMSGAWQWDHSVFDGLTVMATLGWEDHNAIPIDVIIDGGEHIHSTNERFQVSDITFNVKRDALSYMEAMKPEFERAIKLYEAKDVEVDEETKMIQTTFRVEAFITVTSEKPLNPKEAVFIIDAETTDEDEDSKIYEVIETEITEKVITNTAEIDA